MYIFINNIDRTSQVINNSIIIRDELQERINSANLTVAGFNPSFFEEIKIYEGFPILSATATTITLDKNFNIAIQNNIFRVGETLTFALGLSDEETGIITSVDNNAGNIRLNFGISFINIPIKDERAGIKKFAGNIIDVKDKNQTVLENISFDVRCLDFTRVFDKSLVNDTFKNKDARFIVNDFCNKTINNNITIDEFNFTDNADIQASWIESGDGNNPTLDTTDFRETTGSGVFPWTFSSGTANFTNSIIATNLSFFSGVNTGTPTQGVMGLWYRANDFSVITSIEVRLGSDSSNYGSFIITPTNNDWVFVDQKMKDLNITGTPDWTVVDFLEIIITQTGSSEINFDGIRILEEKFFKHFPFVNESTIFADFRIPRVKPTETMQRLADELGWFWYIDYDRNIRLFPESTNFAPISINETSDNFKDLSIKIDPSRIINRQVIKGGDETSEDTYSQVVEGDGFIREWILKNKFKNLIVKLDDNSVTDTMESSTTTTTVKATAHGLVEGDYIVNRTRSNAVRQILTVPDVDTFTVEAVTGQVSGDIFSTFVTQIVGTEGLSTEIGNDYMSNFNEKSIRSSEGKATIDTGDFLQFTYNEVFPILVQRTDNVSVENIKNILGYTNGIFDGQPITDRTISSRSEAIKLAEGKLRKYSNVVITARFRTYQEGLKSGQLIRIKDTISSERNIDQDFVIQSISTKQIAWGENIHTITCSSLLFGFLELLQQLLASNRKIKVEEDEIINNIEDALETITISDSVSSTIGGEVQTETITISDVTLEEVLEPPFARGPTIGGALLLEDGSALLLEDGTNLLLEGKPPLIWNLSSWS